MITKYEIKHCGRSKSFDKLEDACRHGTALEKLGYNVTLNMVTHSLYGTTISTTIYQTDKK